MKKILIACAGFFATSLVLADDVSGTDKFLCAAARANVCVETGDCFSATPAELSMPDFVIVDAKSETVSTTGGSESNRSSKFSSVVRSEGLIHLQGVENQRSFSFVIDEFSGFLTVSIIRDGLSVTVFGACTVADT